jgi:guanylate kinase
VGRRSLLQGLKKEFPGVFVAKKWVDSMVTDELRMRSRIVVMLADAADVLRMIAAGVDATFVCVQPVDARALHERLQQQCKDEVSELLEERLELCQQQLAELRRMSSHFDYFITIDVLDGMGLSSCYQRLRDIVVADYPLVKTNVYPRPLVLCGPAGVGRRALVQGLKMEFGSVVIDTVPTDTNALLVQRNRLVVACQDWPSVLALQDASTDACYIYLAPPSLEWLRARYAASGYSAAEVDSKVAAVQQELQQVLSDRPDSFDHILVHADSTPGSLPAHYIKLRDIVVAQYPLVKNYVYPRPLVLCGPAGVGRRALVQGLKAEFPGVFVTEEWQLQSQPDRRRHQITLLQVDLSQVDEMRRCNLDATFVFISPPDITALRSRFERSGGYSSVQLDDMMATARDEIEKAASETHLFDYIVVYHSAEISGGASGYTVLRDIIASDYPIVFGVVYPRPLVLCGPEGVGRRALVQALKTEFPGVFANVELEENDRRLDRWRMRSSIALLQVSVQKALQLHDAGLSAFYVAAVPASLDELSQRIRSHGGADADALVDRLSQDTDMAVQHAGIFNLTVACSLSDVASAHARLRAALFNEYRILSNVMMPRPLVLSGPEGVGKRALIQGLKAEFPSIFRLQRWHNLLSSPELLRSRGRVRCCSLHLSVRRPLPCCWCGCLQGNVDSAGCDCRRIGRRC